MATRHVALLRGINVGKAKRVPMADLRALVEGLGYSEVRTLLNSGNVVFAAARGKPESIAKRIEKALASGLGVSARVTVLSAAELATIVKQNPLVELADNPSRLMVGFLSDPAMRKQLAPLAKQDWGREAMALGSRAAYVWCPKGVLESHVLPAISKLLRDGWTARNWATVLKLHALATPE